MRELPLVSHPDLLVGYETADDAGVFRLREDLAVVQTVDFITPIVDDPRNFGRVAAANALSDVYAMGGRPVTAMNILCFPAGKLPLEAAREILKGGLDKIREAGAVLVGGHSLRDPELKYGLSVTGVVHPARVVTNSDAQPGDLLIITKPLGTGVIATAIKAGAATAGGIRCMVEAAARLNRTAAEVMLEHGVHACTDVTGFGLGGHLLEMARASNVEITVRLGSVPLYPEVRELASQGFIPGGCASNRNFCAHFIETAGELESDLLELFFDPQTSGGLIIALPYEQALPCLESLHRRGVIEAAIIGEVTGEFPCGKIRLA